MIKLTKPNYTFEEVFDCVINSMTKTKPEVIKFLKDSRQSLIDSSNEYNSLTFPFNLENMVNRISDIQNSGMHRDEFINLFDKFKKNPKPSKIRDEIINTTLHCAYCGKGYPKTLDHFLPKAKFPLLSIEPSNLVPCCYDCNTKLNEIYNSSNPLIIHPYFDHNTEIYDKQWIFAKLSTNQAFFQGTDFSHLSVEFYLDFTQTSLDKNMKKRLVFHYKNLLHEIFTTESSAVLSQEIKRLNQFKNTNNTIIKHHKDYLISQMSGFKVNTYNYAIYQALANCYPYLYTVETYF